MSQLRVAIFLGTPLLIIFAGIGGYFLSSKALSPIDKMTLTAQRISADDLSERLILETLKMKSDGWRLL